MVEVREEEMNEIAEAPSADVVAEAPSADAVAEVSSADAVAKAQSVDAVGQAPSADAVGNVPMPSADAVAEAPKAESKVSPALGVEHEASLEHGAEDKASPALIAEDKASPAPSAEHKANIAPSADHKASPAPSAEHKASPVAAAVVAVVQSQEELRDFLKTAEAHEGDLGDEYTPVKAAAILWASARFLPAPDAPPLASTDVWVRLARQIAKDATGGASDSTLKALCGALWGLATISNADAGLVSALATAPDVMSGLMCLAADAAQRREALDISAGDLVSATWAATKLPVLAAGAEAAKHGQTFLECLFKVVADPQLAGKMPARALAEVAINVARFVEPLPHGIGGTAGGQEASDGSASIQAHHLLWHVALHGGTRETLGSLAACCRQRLAEFEPEQLAQLVATLIACAVECPPLSPPVPRAKLKSEDDKEKAKLDPCGINAALFFADVLHSVARQLSDGSAEQRGWTQASLMAVLRSLHGLAASRVRTFTGLPSSVAKASASFVSALASALQASPETQSMLTHLEATTAADLLAALGALARWDDQIACAVRSNGHPLAMRLLQAVGGDEGAALGTLGIERFADLCSSAATLGGDFLDSRFTKLPTLLVQSFSELVAQEGLDGLRSAAVLLRALAVSTAGSVDVLPVTIPGLQEQLVKLAKRIEKRVKDLLLAQAFQVLVGLLWAFAVLSRRGPEGLELGRSCRGFFRTAAGQLLRPKILNHLAPSMLGDVAWAFAHMGGIPSRAAEDSPAKDLALPKRLKDCMGDICAEEVVWWSTLARFKHAPFAAAAVQLLWSLLVLDFNSDSLCNFAECMLGLPAGGKVAESLPPLLLALNGAPDVAVPLVWVLVALDMMMPAALVGVLVQILGISAGPEAASRTAPGSSWTWTLLWELLLLADAPAGTWPDAWVQRGLASWREEQEASRAAFCNDSASQLSTLLTGLGLAHELAVDVGQGCQSSGVKVDASFQTPDGMRCFLEIVADVDGAGPAATIHQVDNASASSGYGRLLVKRRLLLRAGGRVLYMPASLLRSGNQEAARSCLKDVLDGPKLPSNGASADADGQKAVVSSDLRPAAAVAEVETPCFQPAVVPVEPALPQDAETESDSETDSDSSSSAEDEDQLLQPPAVQTEDVVEPTNGGPHESQDEIMCDAALAERLHEDLGSPDVDPKETLGRALLGLDSSSGASEPHGAGEAGQEEKEASSIKQPVVSTNSASHPQRAAAPASTPAVLASASRPQPVAAPASTPAVPANLKAPAAARARESPAAAKATAAKAQPATGVTAMDDVVQRRIAEASQKAERLAKQRMEEARQRAETAAQQWRQVAKETPKEAETPSKAPAAGIVKPAVGPSNAAPPLQLTTFPLADAVQAAAYASPTSSDDDSSSASEDASKTQHEQTQQSRMEPSALSQPLQPQEQIVQDMFEQAAQEVPMREQLTEASQEVPMKEQLTEEQRQRNQQQLDLLVMQLTQQQHHDEQHQAQPEQLQESQFPPRPAVVSGAVSPTPKDAPQEVGVPALALAPSPSGMPADGQEVTQSRKKRKRKRSRLDDGQHANGSGLADEPVITKPASHHAGQIDEFQPLQEPLAQQEVPAQNLTKQALANSKARPKRKPKPEAGAPATPPLCVQLQMPTEGQASFELAKGSERKRSCMDQSATIKQVIKRYKRKWGEASPTGGEVLLCFSRCISAKTASLDNGCPVQDRPILRLKVPVRA